ncbi:hypothetical protein KP509_08G049100 [Ceratopteris richardii]|nr:hypothetical protein KP509_08G049100 [Ceratopteris richardii]
MYAKCGALIRAREVLNELPLQDVVSWNALIGGYVQNGQGNEALNCYEQMQSEGIYPDAVTYSCILKACGITERLDHGRKIHDEVMSKDLLRGDILLGSALVDMYVKCGELKKAQEVLDELPARDAACWNTMIGGYVQSGHGEKALCCFSQMQSEGLSPTAITYSCILKACAITDALVLGVKIHEEIVDQGLLEKNVVLGTALLDMYAKCGNLSKAELVVNELPIRDVVMWNALITGYVQEGLCKEALACFEKMQSDGISPDASTYSCILKVCSITNDVTKGKQIHDQIIHQGLTTAHVVIGTSLVNMYAKCGELEKARQVLDELHVRDEISWNALIAGYAQQGQGKKALECIKFMQRDGLTPNLASWNAVIGGYAQQGLAEEALSCFQWMQGDGVLPDAITFVCVLSACSHAGLVEEGQTFFCNMSSVYGIKPNMEHLTCMIDLLGRTGHFDKAMEVIEKIASSDDPLVWSTILSSCEKWGNLKLGKWAFDHAIQLDGHDPVVYICMERMYCAVDMEENAKEVAEMRMRNLKLL